MIMEPLMISLMLRRISSSPSFAAVAAFSGVRGMEEVGDEDGKTS